MAYDDDDDDDDNLLSLCSGVWGVCVSFYNRFIESINHKTSIPPCLSFEGSRWTLPIDCCSERTRLLAHHILRPFELSGHDGQRVASHHG